MTAAADGRHSCNSARKQTLKKAESLPNRKGYLICLDVGGIYINFFLIVIIVAVCIAVFLKIANDNYEKSRKNTILGGRLTREVISFLETEDTIKFLQRIEIKRNHIVLHFYSNACLQSEFLKYKIGFTNCCFDFRTYQPLNETDMRLFAKVISERLGNDFSLVYHKEESDYTPIIGSVGGTTVYGKTEYGDLAYFEIVRSKTLSEPTTNW